jgi:hypothetical protein
MIRRGSSCTRGAGGFLSVRRTRVERRQCWCIHCELLMLVLSITIVDEAAASGR